MAVKPPPNTRALQTWTRFWQRYNGTIPDNLHDYNRKVGPALRQVTKQIGRDGPVPKSLLGKVPPLAAEASAGEEVGATAVARGAARKVVAIPAALGTLLVFIVFWVLYHAWKITFGAIFSYIGAQGIDFDKSFIHVHIKPFAFVANINRGIENNLSAGLAFSERAFVTTVNTFIEPLLLLVGTVLAIGYALYYLGRSAEHAIAHRIPKTVTETIVKPVQRIARGALTALTNRVTALEHTVHQIRPQVNYITRLVVDVPKSLRLRVGRIETRLRKDEHDIAQLQKKVGVAGMAGIFGAVLVKLGLDWLRCRNVSRLGRGICRMNPNLLRYLLGASFEAFAVLDLCALIKAEVALAEWFQPLMMELVDVDEWLIKNCGYTKAPDLTLPPLTLPAGSYGIALNAERDYLVGLAG